MPDIKSFIRKHTPMLLIFALMCAIGSIIAVCLSAWHSGDKKQLFKLAAPATIIIIMAAAYRRNKKAKM